MTLDEDTLRQFKNAVFNSGVNPGRTFVEFFASAMGWPVDAYAPQTIAHTGNIVEHRVTWFKGDLIGYATCTVGGGNPSSVSAMVRPLHAVTSADIGATVDDDPVSPSVVRSLRLHFAGGLPFVLEPATFANWAQRQPADEFIDAVIGAISRPKVSD